MELFRDSAGFSGELKWNEPLSLHTYYRLGGPAQLLAIPKNIQDLNWLSERLTQSKIPYFFLGAGSNLLVSDQGFRGVVIKSSRISQQIQLADQRLEVGASVLIASLLRRAAQEGWSGLEFMGGIPGSIGGAVVMNAGTHLGEAKDRLEEIEIFSFGDRKSRRISKDEFVYSYRHNGFLKTDDLVVSTVWRIDLESPSCVKTRIDAILKRRKDSQPVDQPSCGSVFKNPKSAGLHAWQVIEKLGLRGHTIGGAQFSLKHANFIVNLGGAKAADVRALIELAKKEANQKLGVELEEEVKYLGF